MQKVLIITGGLSSERVVSLKSARFVSKGLKIKGYKTKLFDLKKGYDSLLDESKKYDIIFPVIHGEEGEGGALTRFLIKTKKPIVGTKNYKGLKDSWYKISFKKYCGSNKILTPRWKLVKEKKDIVGFSLPCVLKGSVGGSSKEVLIIKDSKYLKSRKIDNLLKTKNKFFVEEFIEGTEVTVGILDNKALPLLKIIPPKGEWFSYKNKYSNKTQEIVNPKDIKEETQENVRKIGLKIHRSFNLGSYSRIDFMLVDNKAFVLEVNTIPGLTSESLLPKMAKMAGYSFEDFVEKLVKLAK